jgi:hypothetical protein
MAKKSKDQRTWYERVFDAADFSDKVRGGVDIEHEPPWVLNVMRDLVQQATPILQFRKTKHLTPKVVGRCLGQICANVYAIGELMPKNPEAVERGRRIEKVLQKNQQVPSVKSTLKAMEFAGQSIIELGSAITLIESTIMESFKAALDQSSREEAADFFRGFADGIAKPGITGKPSLAGATTATPIYQRLLVHRREIEKLKSVRELRDFFLQLGLPEQVVGDNKRMEKICERIELTFGSRGRKKSAN